MLLKSSYFKSSKFSLLNLLQKFIPKILIYVEIQDDDKATKTKESKRSTKRRKQHGENIKNFKLKKRYLLLFEVILLNI